MRCVARALHSRSKKTGLKAGFKPQTLTFAYSHPLTQGTFRLLFPQWLEMLGELGKSSGYDMYALLIGHVHMLKADTETQQVCIVSCLALRSRLCVRLNASSLEAYVDASA